MISSKHKEQTPAKNRPIVILPALKTISFNSGISINKILQKALVEQPEQSYEQNLN